MLLKNHKTKTNNKNKNKETIKRAIEDAKPQLKKYIDYNSM